MQDLLRHVPEAADRLLLLDEPALPSPGHLYHQAYSLKHGLTGRANEDLVLRLRPDIFIDDGFLPNMAKSMQALDRPLWSPYADLTCPFFACDMVFGGRAWALRAQTNFASEPYLVPTPGDFEREPGRIYSHEPEVQRWLHPARDLDWRTQAYWTQFPSFGFVTAQRPALMTQYRDWDFYHSLRAAWLEYLTGNRAGRPEAGGSARARPHGSAG